MKIDFEKELTDFTGETIKMDNRPDSKPLTLKQISLIAIKTPLADDQSLPFTEKIKVVDIGIKINRGKEITTDDAATLKERISKCFPAAVVAEAVDRAIEGKDDPFEKKEEVQ